MKKSLVGIVLALIMVVCMVPLKASAVELVASGTCGENVSYMLGSDGLLRISAFSGPGRMWDFDYNLDNAHANPFVFYKSKITGVTIDENVTYIGRSAFINFKNITRVDIANDATVAGYKAFYGCNALEGIFCGEKDVTIKYVDKDELDGERFRVKTASCGTDCTYTLYNDGLLVISGTGKATGLFNKEYLKPDYKPVRWVVIEDGVTELNHSIFSGCEELESVVLPETLKKVDLSAFLNCNCLGKVYLHGSLSSLDELELEPSNDALKNAPSIINEDHTYIANANGTFTCDVCQKTVDALPAKSEDKKTDSDDSNKPVVEPEKTTYVTNKVAVKAKDGSMVTTTSKGEATLTESKKASGKVVSVSSKVTVESTEYVVTGIGDNAFTNAKATTANIDIASGNYTVSKTAFSKSSVKKVILNMSDNISKSDKKKIVKAFKKAGIKKKNIMAI